MSLFDQRDMAAITSPDYPGERRIVCRNRDLARERAASERTYWPDEKDPPSSQRRFGAPASRCAARRDCAQVGAVVNRHKMAKHFDLVIGEASFAFHRKAGAIAAEAAAIAAEAALDGIYVVRTSCRRERSATRLPSAPTKVSPRSSARSALEDVDIHLRPIFHWTTPRVRAHVFLCMLAYHVEHHMRARPHALRRDRSRGRRRHAHEHRRQGRALRRARRSKDRPHDDGLPVHSFRSLLADLATYCRTRRHRPQ